MASLPPPPPPPPQPPQQVDVRVNYAEASSRVSLPATLLMVVGGLGILLDLLSVVLNLLGTSLGALAPSGGGDERFAAMFSGGLGIVSALFGLALYAAMIYGAMKMKNLENYAFAMAASIIAMLPCNCPCCLFGLPLGIWALVVLMDNNVKTAFRS